MALNCTYSQTTRHLVCTDETGAQVVNVQGNNLTPPYSGAGVGRDNSGHNNTHNVGPTPRGTWTIGASFNHATKGPNVIRITHNGGEAFPIGRDPGTFLIHGDNNAGNASASQGCLILQPAHRQAIINGGGGTLTVTN